MQKMWRRVALSGTFLWGAACGGPEQQAPAACGAETECSDTAITDAEDATEDGTSLSEDVSDVSTDPSESAVDAAVTPEETDTDAPLGTDAFAPTDATAPPDVEDPPSIETDAVVTDEMPSDGSDAGSEIMPPDETDPGVDDPGMTDVPTQDGGTSLPEPEPEPEPEPAPVLDTPPERVDLLFTIDNSISMVDKQSLLAITLPDLIERLVSPFCRAADGWTQPPDADGDCPAGTTRQFAPIRDLHVGVITTSLGGYGAVADCVSDARPESEQRTDMARLLGSLPRGADAAPGAADSGFLSWSAGTQVAALASDFADLVLSAGEFGCGWEASLESWTRFLVDPYPYTRIVRVPCNDSDTSQLCNGPETDADGNVLVDQALLTQRAAFLRPDSLLAVVMFTDENDCSFKPNGQSWRLAQTVESNGGFNAAFKGAAACDDPAYGANHECCRSCGYGSVLDGCPSTVDDEGRPVPVGCEESRRYSISGEDDHPNLRCFQQQRRFGVDYLFPVERYVNALSQEFVCPTNDTLAVEGCDVDVVRNPIFEPFDGKRRPEGWAFLTGIVGVPWQDLALDPSGDEPLRYRSSATTGDAAINWDWVLGDFDPIAGTFVPEDPLMLEQIAPRSGVNPATGVAVAGPDADVLENPINGHEWDILDRSDLQYACIFPLPEPLQCLTRDEYRAAVDNGEAVSACDCTDFGDESFKNPLCQASDGGYGLTQRFGKAYPGLRQLQVLRDLGPNAVVGSICPKEVNDQAAPDFGYRPTIDALVERFAAVLAPE